jgi:hypothetical protein
MTSPRLSLFATVAWFALLAARGACAAEPANADPFPQTRTKKGLQVQMIDDALALGVEHAALNVDLTRLIDPLKTSGGPTYQRGEQRYSFTKSAVEDLDWQIKPLSDRGVVVYLILLPYASGDSDRDKLMLHPDYARGEKDAGPIAMFNTTTAESAAWLAATVEFLASRYSRDGGHGRVWGYIAGNEVNSHWFWANMGLAADEEVVAAYERAVRAIHSAVRTWSANARVYISLEHCWARRYAGGNARQAIAGSSFLDSFAALARQHGDFDWHVAYHPYPEPLTDCRFWLDTRHSLHKSSSPVVSFRNLEVLMQHLAQEELRWNGEPRRVILSEQGFHCSDRPAAEQEQAAAYALACKVVARHEGIDAFILHRHVDHAHEGGLRLGLWTRQKDSICTPDRQRAMYDVFRSAGTAEEEVRFAFALQVVGGGENWDDVLTKMAGH